MLFWQQGKKVEALVERHLALVEATLKAFDTALNAHLAGDPQTERLARIVHEHESRADDVRREVIAELIHGALLGHYRGDMLRLVERLDSLANGADALASRIVLEKIRIPSELEGHVREICDKTMDIVNELSEAVHALFSDMRQVLAHTNRVEKTEGQIDQVEHAAIQTLFAMDLPLAEKLWVRGFFTHLAQLSDRAEDLSDLIEIIVAKRRV